MRRKGIFRCLIIQRAKCFDITLNSRFSNDFSLKVDGKLGGGKEWHRERILQSPSEDMPFSILLTSYFPLSVKETLSDLCLIPNPSYKVSSAIWLNSAVPLLAQQRQQTKLFLPLYGLFFSGVREVFRIQRQYKEKIVLVLRNCTQKLNSFLIFNLLSSFYRNQV